MQLRAIAKSSRAIDGRIIERPAARPSPPVSPAILTARAPVTFSSVAAFLLVPETRGPESRYRAHPSGQSGSVERTASRDLSPRNHRAITFAFYR